MLCSVEVLCGCSCCCCELRVAVLGTSCTGVCRWRGLRLTGVCCDV